MTNTLPSRIQGHHTHPIIEVLAQNADSRTTAVALAELGASVFPLAPGAKNPATSHGFFNASADPLQVQEMFTSPSYNIGLVAKNSRVVIIDCDNQDTTRKMREFLPQVLDITAEEAESIPFTVTTANAQNPNSKKFGGGQWWMFLPDGVNVPEGMTNLSLAKYLGVEHLDILGGQGGYVVVPPSGIDGYHYKVTGSDLPYTEKLHDILTLASQPSKKTATNSAPLRSDEDRDEFTRQVDDALDWSDVFDGRFSVVGDDRGCEVLHYVNASADKSITVHADAPCGGHGAGGATVFSTTVLSEFPYLQRVVDSRDHSSDTPTFTKFQMYVAVHHDGDVSSALRELGIETRTTNVGAFDPSDFDFDVPETRVGDSSDIDRTRFDSDTPSDTGWYEDHLDEPDPVVDPADLPLGTTTPLSIPPAIGGMTRTVITSKYERIPGSRHGMTVKLTEFDQTSRKQTTVALGMSGPPILPQGVNPIPLKVPNLDDIEDDGTPNSPLIMEAVFNASPLLKHCAESARIGLFSPFAAVAGVIRDTAMHVPINVALPALIMTQEASLNTFHVAVGESGLGKSGSQGNLVDIAPRDKFWIFEHMQGMKNVYVDTANRIDTEKREPASGEAIPALFSSVYTDPDTKERALVQHTDAVMLYWDEVDKFVSKMKSEGSSSLSSDLRSVWSGGGVGTYTKSDAGRIYLLPGTYRAPVLIAAQYENVSGLLDNASGGTPQRTFWYQVSDPNPQSVEDDDPDLIIIPWKVILPSIDGLYVSPRVRMEIRNAQRTKLRNSAKRKREGLTTTDDLTEGGHRFLVRMKEAALIALAHGLPGVTDEVWEWSKWWMLHSQRVRASISDTQRATRKRKIIAKAKETVDTVTAQGIWTIEKFDPYIEKVEKWGKENPDTLLTKRELSRTLASKLAKDKSLLEFIDYAKDLGVLEEDGKGFKVSAASSNSEPSKGTDR